MKTPKGPNRIKAHFPPPRQAAPAPAKPKVADFALNFTTPEKVITISMGSDQMEKFAVMFTSLLKHAEIVFTKEEKLR